MIYGLLALYKTWHSIEVGDAILKWSDAIEGMRVGGGYKTYFSFRKCHAYGDIEKTQNFPLIDIFIEIYRAFGEKGFLEKAVQCADFWLGLKTSAGLVPEKPDCGYARLDQSADFYTMLIKLYEISGKRRYLGEAKKGLRTFKYFLTDDGWWHERVDSRSGKPLQFPNQTKFVGGALRFFILMHEIMENKQIYKNEIIEYLVRDR